MQVPRRQSRTISQAGKPAHDLLEEGHGWERADLLYSDFQYGCPDGGAQITWDHPSLKGYRLQAGDYVETKRMVIVR